jgi:hypothetical protein
MSIILPVAKPGFYVYQYVIDGKLVYIGKGTDRRFKRHIYFAKRGSDFAFHKVLLGAIRRDKEIVVSFVQEEMTEESAKELEMLLITQHGRKLIDGGQLLNFSGGGDGLDSAAATAIHKRPEVIEKQRASIKATLAKPGVKERQSALGFAMGQDKEIQAKKSVAMRAKYGTPEYKEILSNRAKQLHADPVWSAKRTESLRKAYSNPELLARISVASRASRSKPGVREAIGLGGKQRAEAGKYFGIPYHKVTREMRLAYLEQTAS